MVKSATKSIIHIDYSSDVKIKRIDCGLRYDAVIEIGDGCNLFVSEKHLKTLNSELNAMFKKNS